MIPFEKALKIVLQNARPVGAATIPLPQALGRVLAEDVRSDMDMPPFNKSAMDGYACRRCDLDNDLQVIETIAAGQFPQNVISQNQCAKIMTGAPVPEGADCIVMVEYTENPTPKTIRFTGKNTQDNICLKAEDIRCGDIVLNAGTILEPQHIAVLATVGKAHPLVSRRPIIGIIATGDELVEPDQKPGPSQIRTSNSHQLYAQALRAETQAINYGIVADTEIAIGTALKQANKECDIVLLSGGVSMGEFDLVPDVMKKNGFEMLFDSIAMKPGKPTKFGVSPEALCIGLPGNPVSTFVQFEILIRPLILKMMGADHNPKTQSLPLTQEIKRKNSERMAWLPVRITPSGKTTPCEHHGSAHINSLVGADGLIAIPLGTNLLEKGTLVDVRPI